MKLKDIDFRAWYSDDESILYANKEHLFLGYSQRECGGVIQEYGELAMHVYLDGEPLCPDACEVELFTGFCDKDGKKIYEGDIVAHYVEGGGIEYHSKVVFNKEKGAFELVCIEHPVVETCGVLANPDIGVVGDIHENTELLGDE